MFVARSVNYVQQFQKFYLQNSPPLNRGIRFSLLDTLHASFWSAGLLNLIMEGWILLHKKFLDWEWSNDPNMVCLFIHLLIRANYEPSKWRGEIVKRGQILTGRKQLSEWTGLSDRKIRTCLSRLKTTSEVTIRTTNKYSIITICNYNKYQKKTTSEVTIQTPTSDQQPTTSKEDKETKEERDIYIHPLNKFIFKSLPHVSKLDGQPTPEQCDWLIKTYGKKLVEDKLLSMENKKDLLKKYKSCYLTLQNWCKMAYEKA